MVELSAELGKIMDKGDGTLRLRTKLLDFDESKGLFEFPQNGS